MLDKTQVTKVAVAGFGAAMATVFAIPEAHATIIPISFNPGWVATGSVRTVDVKTANGGAEIFSMHVGNGTAAKSMWAGRYTSLAVEPVGKTISAGMFRGTHGMTVGWSAAGTDYIGFRSPGGGAGWFAVNWGGVGGFVSFLKGAYNDAEGGSIVVGQMPAGVPEPSELGLMALGLLALGAAGVRMRREARKAAELN